MKKEVKVFIIDKDEISSSVISAYLKETGLDMSISIFEDLASAEKEISENALNLFITDISENHEKYFEQIEKRNRN